MTGKTVCNRIITDKALSVCHMRGMTGTAVALGNRVMNNPLGKCFFLLPVTGITEDILPVAQQALILGDMGIMTDIAPGIGNRFMHHLAGKQGCIMASETGEICCP